MVDKQSTYNIKFSGFLCFEAEYIAVWKWGSHNNSSEQVIGENRIHHEYSIGIRLVIKCIANRKGQKVYFIRFSKRILIKTYNLLNDPYGLHGGMNIWL